MASTSLGNPQSFNQFAYVGNNPVDFTDPSGLITSYVTCEPRFQIDRNREGDIVSAYVEYDCEIHYEPSFGGGGGGGSVVPEDCETALKFLGVFDRVVELLKNTPIFDIDGILGMPDPHPDDANIDEIIGTNITLANRPASVYFGALAKGGETVGEHFDRRNADAIAIRGPRAIEGIYYRSSKYNLPTDSKLLLHEITHLAFPPEIPADKDSLNLDKELVEVLGIITKGDDYSGAVSNFFNNDCNPSLLEDGLILDEN